MQALRALLSVLDDRGRREARLIESLEKRESFLCQAMLRRIDHVVREDSSSSPVSDIDNNNLCLNEIANDQQAAIVFEKRGKSLLWSLVQEFDEWIWDKYYLNLNAVINTAEDPTLIHLLGVRVVMICIGEMRSTVRFAMLPSSLI